MHFKLTLLLVFNSESSIKFRQYLFYIFSSMTLSYIVDKNPKSTEGDPKERKKDRRAMTERLYRDSVKTYNFLFMMRTMTPIIMIMMMMTRTIILLLITIVNLIIFDIAVIVRAEVSSHNNTSHIELASTPHDTLNSTNYTSTDTIITFNTILIFLSSFCHKLLFLYLLPVLLLSFYSSIEQSILVRNSLCSPELSLP